MSIEQCMGSEDFGVDGGIVVQKCTGGLQTALSLTKKCD